jgi:hypothetical protein
MKFLLHSLFFVCALTTTKAQGTFEAIFDYVPGQTVGTIFGTGGWTFSPTSTITLTDLGCTTNAVADNGPTEVDVGLWNSSGQLLGSAVIRGTNAPVNQTFYQSVTPVVLVAGQTYHLGAYSPTGSILLNILQNGNGLTMASQVQLGIAVTADGSFAWPNTAQSPNGWMFLGPTFRYLNIPEPSVMALLTLGGVTFLLRRRLSR